MAGKKDKNKPVITRKDADLWKAVTKDVRRMKGREYEDGGDEEENVIPAPIKERIGVTRRERLKEAHGRDVDRRTAEKLARGKMKIEGSIDLHGMNQIEAHENLARFIRSSHSRGRRCVLVITGKGRDGKPGILRKRVPEWLNEPPLEAYVLRIAQAKQHDGGAGAIYVLLRRKRG